MKTAETTLIKGVAANSIRCRYCWKRMSAGTPIVMNAEGAVFHADCPPKFYGFPEFERLTPDGVIPEDMSEPDHYYPHRHERDFRNRRRR